MYLIGIAGGSGSGKTTFAHKVLEHIKDVECKILSMDSYYLGELPESVYTEKKKANFDHPDSFDWDLLHKHLTQLQKNEPIQVPVYDFKTSSRMNSTEELNPSNVIIFEGIFTLFNPKIRELLDIKCFLRVDADIRFTRRLHRDVKERGRSLESVIAQYYDTVRPMYMKYLDPQKEFADFTVGEETDVAAEILAARIKELVRNKN